MPINQLVHNELYLPYPPQAQSAWGFGEKVFELRDQQHVVIISIKKKSINMNKFSKREREREREREEEEEEEESI